jgi:polyisoprenoid-binding protein YceI
MPDRLTPGISTLLRAALLLLIAATPSLHAQQTLTLDPAHSEVHFTLSDTIHTVHGTFHIQQGEIAFDPATGKSSGAIIVDALSGQSGNSTRDHRMTDDELKASTFKTISFAPISFTGTFNLTGDSNLIVHGLFTLLGTANQLDVPMKVHASANQLQATGTFAVPYIQWGLKDPSTFMIHVNKEVQIDLTLTGTLHH